MINLTSNYAEYNMMFIWLISSKSIYYTNQFFLEVSIIYSKFDIKYKQTICYRNSEILIKFIIKYSTVTIVHEIRNAKKFIYYIPGNNCWIVHDLNKWMF